MLLEILLLFAGHQYSPFPMDHTLRPVFAPLLQPGDQQCLEFLSFINLRYHIVKAASARLVGTSSRYASPRSVHGSTSFCGDEYEILIVRTETHVMKRDTAFVGAAPSSGPRIIRTMGDAAPPLAALAALMERL
jgi:hypothetical protein